MKRVFVITEGYPFLISRICQIVDERIYDLEKKPWNVSDIHSLNKGYLVIFNFNKNKEFKEERINTQGKNIFGVYV